MRKILYVLIISAIPLIEQRGAIPVGILMDLSPLTVFIASYIGSLIPVPFIFYLFNFIMRFMKEHHLFPGFVGFIERKIQKNTGKFEKYKEAALITFIGIPLPTTGVWTGTAVATFLGLDFKKCCLCAMVGALISAVVITLICVMLPGLASALF